VETINNGARSWKQSTHHRVKIELVQQDVLHNGVDIGTEPGTGFYEERNLTKEPIHIDMIEIGKVGRITQILCGIQLYYLPGLMRFAPMIWHPDIVLRIDVESPHTLGLVKPVELVLVLAQNERI